MGTIVVGFDGSSCSEGALQAAASLAKGLGDDVVVVFGYAPPGIWGGEIAEHEMAIEEIGERVTAEAEGRFKQAGVEAEVKLIAKRASEALIEAADECDARMIVVGSFGETPLKGVILGSTPHKLLHLADRPVLVVPGKKD